MYTYIYMEIEKIIAIGLTKKEASLYLAALQQGISSITDLAKSATLKRPTAYLILEDLLQKRLIVPVQVGKTTHYKAGDPAYFAKDIESKRILMTKLLPELNYLYKHSLKLENIKLSIRKTKKLIIEKKKPKTNMDNGTFTINKFFFSFTKKK